MLSQELNLLFAKKRLKRDLVKEFAIQHSIVKNGYHGGEFEVSKL